MSLETYIKNSSLKSDQEGPYLVVEACPFFDKHHPLDEWFSKARQTPHEGSLFKSLKTPAKLKLAIEQLPDSGEIHGSAYLNWELGSQDGANHEKFQVRCEYNDFERTYRISLSGDDVMNDEFVQLLAKEIEPYQISAD